MKYSNYIILFGLVFTTNISSAGPSAWDIAKESYAGTKNITVYRSSDCDCCKDWINHLKKHAFNIIDRPTNKLSAIKQKYGVPKNMASCHTATIDGYVIEGHVPADDIKKLLKARPNITGLSVPKMPHGTPGMERGNRKDPFAVIQFNKSGKAELFKEYQSY